MASAAAISGSISSHTLLPRELRPAQIGTIKHLDPSPAAIRPRRRRLLATPPRAVEPHRRTDSVIPSAAAVSAAAATPSVVEKRKVEEEDVDYEKLADELDHSSPLEIMDRALEKFGNDIAIAFSGAEDVALIEYAQLTGRPFRVFSLDTGRLNPETYRFFDAVEKHYDIRIEYMFPDSVKVQALVRTKGLFSFYDDGHQECCKISPPEPEPKSPSSSSIPRSKGWTVDPAAW